jgi:ribosome-associated heat shock protein Hsp15
MSGLRIDKWLWFARFCKSRSLAQELIDGGEVSLNGRPVGKAGTTVKPGDEVVFPIGRGWRRVSVLALGSRRGPAPEARLLYQDLPLGQGIAEETADWE